MAQGSARRLSPSNRGESGTTDTKAQVSPRAEIDSFGLAYVCRLPDSWDGWSAQVDGLGTAQEAWRYRRKLDGGGFINAGVGGKCWVEGSLPKRVSADNVHALGLAEALEAARSMMEEAFEHVPPDRSRGGHDFGAAKVIRGDLVRDFDGVTKVAELLDGLAVGAQSGRTKVRRFADGERGQAETLRVGPKAWANTLYDKWAESVGVAPPGRLRFETRLHSAQLQSRFAIENGGAIGVVADLEEYKLRKLTEAMFKRTGFDRQVSGVPQVVHLVMEDPTLSIKQKREFLLYLFARGVGADLGFERHAIARYRKIAQRLGIVAGLQIHEPSAITVSLDFNKGTEVLHAA